MVLQNKYKARASRRYNAARGGTSDGRGRGGRGRGGGVARHRVDETSFPSLPGQQSDAADDGNQDEQDDGEDSEEVLRARQEQAKYAPRKLVSNAWRFEPPSDEETAGGGSGDKQDAQSGTEAEPEPEVDLSGLLARVAKLDSSRTSKALSSERAAQLAQDAEAADVDASLLFLLDRQRQRERAAAAAAEEHHGDTITSNLPRHILSDEQRAELEREGRRLQDEKVQREKHQRRARILQQAAGSGAKSMSLDIGPTRRKDDDEGDVRRRPQRDGATSAGGSRFASHLLYDDDDDIGDRGNNIAASNDVDNFLNELHHSDYDVSSSVARSASPSLSKTSVNTHPSRSAKADDAHVNNDEDFLDSIL